MKQLSKEAFYRAQSFIKSTARPLEEALFAYHISDASAQWALQELASFQNEDGGFGHGLEPDLQLADSSVLATTVAMQHLRDMQAGSDHELVQGAINYFLNQYDAQAKAWPFIPPNSDSAPHAPWWQYDPDLSGFLSNPRPEIVGYLLDYAALVPDNLDGVLLDQTLSHLESLNGELEMHELLCYARLLNSNSLPAAAYRRLFNLLEPVVEKKVARDAQSWDQYGLKPLAIAPTPSAPFASQLSGVIEENLDYEIERQMNDGSWVPPWTWGDSYPEAWPHAKRAWQGVITVNNLRSLKAFGRIA